MFAARFAHKSQPHFFREIGYERNPYSDAVRRSTEKDLWQRERCTCGSGKSFGALSSFSLPPYTSISILNVVRMVADYSHYSCLGKWDTLFARVNFCRNSCECMLQRRGLVVTKTCSFPPHSAHACSVILPRLVSSIQSLVAHACIIVQECESGHC